MLLVSNIFFSASWIILIVSHIFLSMTFKHLFPFLLHYITFPDAPGDFTYFILFNAVIITPSSRILWSILYVPSSVLLLLIDVYIHSVYFAFGIFVLCQLCKNWYASLIWFNARSFSAFIAILSIHLYFF